MYSNLYVIPIIFEIELEFLKGDPYSYEQSYLVQYGLGFKELYN